MKVTPIIFTSAMIFSLFIILSAQHPNIPEKRPVFKIEDEDVKEDLIKRGLIKEYPDGTRVIDLKGVEELIKKEIYEINPDGVLKLKLNSTKS